MVKKGRFTSGETEIEALGQKRAKEQGRQGDSRVGNYENHVNLRLYQAFSRLLRPPIDTALPTGKCAQGERACAGERVRDGERVCGSERAPDGETKAQ